MNEAEWKSCTHPFKMLDYLEQSGIDDRTLRLFGVECCRLISKVFADAANSAFVVQKLIEKDMM